YYTNIEFPDDPALFKVAQDVTGDWNGAFKKTIAALQLSAGMPGQVIHDDAINKAADGIDDIVVLRKNSCNLEDVKAWLACAGNATVADTVKTAIGIDGDNLDSAHLAQTCAIMEAMTQTLPDEDPETTTVATRKKFTWQRNGDLRYSFFYWVDRPEPTMPL